MEGNDKLLNSVIRWMTLKRGWYLYLIALAAFIISNTFVDNSLFTSLGINVMTILALFLIMITSNQELRKSTEKEAKAFIESITDVTSELLKVSEASKKTAEVLSRVEQHIASMSTNTKDMFVYEKKKDEEEIERLRPRLVVTLKTDKWGIFWVHYFLIVVNNGEEAKDLQVSYLMNKTWFNATYPKLLRGKQVTVDCGDITIFRGVSTLQVYISTYDEKSMHYEAFLNVDTKKADSIPVPLELKDY